ncbi:protein-ER retention protein [Podochytrium sp. JEL0797]|nr:protein-ER retention protein [Podochytrium sp. JEL0797]
MTPIAKPLLALCLLAVLYSALSRLVIVVTHQLPVYFHVLLLVNLGLFCWASNIHILILSGISPTRILQYTDPAAEQTLPSNLLSLHSSHFSLRPKNLYIIACAYAGITIAAISFFTLVVWMTKSEEKAEFVPLLAYVLMLGLLVLGKADFFFGNERRWFINAFRRIAFGTLASPVPFCDVIFADILTSYSKVLGDLHLVAQDLLAHQSDHDANVNQRRDGTTNVGGVGGAGKFMEVIGILLVCLPFLFRLRQCLAEYCQTVNNPAAQTRHLMNALKYCTAFPVIAASWLINWVRAEISLVAKQSAENDGIVVAKSRLIGSILGDNQTIDERKIEFVLNFAIGIWIFFSIINSVYSLYWDIYVDWQLGNWNTPVARRGNNTKSSNSRVATIQLNTLQHQHSSESGPSSSSSDTYYTEEDSPLTPTSTSTPTTSYFPPFLRRHMHFRTPLLYYAAIIFNTLLRMSWIVRVAILHALLKNSFGGQDVSAIKGTLLGVDLGLKGLEVLRRWAWVFFRVEREWVGGKERGVVREVKG